MRRWSSVSSIGGEKYYIVLWECMWMTRTVPRRSTAQGTRCHWDPHRAVALTYRHEIQPWFEHHAKPFLLHP
eukprot:25864-Eustigmatos_ZCMA.PRE.1